MSIIIAALAVAGAQPAQTQSASAQPMDHAQHQQMGEKQDAKGCACCEKMADGKKMACCEKHEKTGGEDHAGHSGH